MLVNKDSNIYRAYNKLEISERHRHRYEFNNHYLEAFEAAGMKAVGVNPDTNLVKPLKFRRISGLSESSFTRIQQYGTETTSAVCSFCESFA
jgi:CTP synthase (UTP-ammonia lyase)